MIKKSMFALTLPLLALIATTNIAHANDPPDAPVQVYLPIIANGSPPDSRFGVNGVSTDSQTLGFPVHDRYVLSWPEYPLSDDEADQMSVYRIDHADRGMSRNVSTWCLTTFKIAGRPNYCDDTTNEGWVDEPGFRQFILSHPGKTWIVGNEPITPIPAGMRSILPEEYATWYHTAYYFIKGIDPSAKVGMYGMCMAPIEREFTMQVWSAYRELYGETFPTDFIAMHRGTMPNEWTSYGLQGEIDLHTERVSWFDARRGIDWAGPREYWLTEYGMPARRTPIGEAMALEYMLEVTTWLKSQSDLTQWAWWPSGSQYWEENTRLVEDGKPTKLGELYIKLAK